jgi:hypothetical protein
MPKQKMRVVMYMPATTYPFGALPGKPAEQVTFLHKKILIPAAELTKDDGDDVLRVFLAPEWLFRQSAPPKSSKLEEYSGIPYTQKEKEQIISGLRSISGQTQFRNWLIVPGSITWGYVRQGTEAFNWYNTAPVLMGGAVLREYHKRHDQDEFLGPYKEFPVVKPTIVTSKNGGTLLEDGSKGAQGFTNWKNSPDTHLLVPALESNTPFFDLDGRSFCIETCADFASGTALREYAQHDPAGEGIDVHLVIAAGVPPGPTDYVKSTARQDGYLIICDSGSAQSTVNLRSAVYKIQERQGSVKASASQYSDNSSSPNETIRGQRITPADTDVCWVGNQPIPSDKRLKRNYEVIIYSQLFDLPNEPVGETVSTLSSTLTNTN